MAEVRAEQQGDARNETAGRAAATASPGVAPAPAICPALDGSPAAGVSANGSPASGSPANGSPASGSPANGVSANGSPANGQVVPEEPTAVGEPVVVEEPVAVGEPAAQQPVTGEEPVAVGASVRRPGSGGLGRRLLAAGTALVVVALAVALGITAHSLSSKDAADSSRAAALAAARADAAELGSYDYAHLDQDVAGVLSHSTPAFTKSYNQSIDTIKALLVKFKATATATVVGAGVESYGSGHADVLIALNQVVTNTSKKGSTSAQSRLQMDMVRYHGHWDINQISYLDT